MAHPQQKAFCSAVKARFPHYFNGVLALDIGSLDLNGNNQYLFDASCQYLGIDVAEGRNVDIVSPGHLLGMPAETFDVIVSTECLEHDRHWELTLQEAVRMLRPGGMLLMTCATTGRPEHGTRRTTPHDAPLLSSVDDEWADYYRNLDEQDVRSALDVPKLFQMIEFSVGEETHDLYCVAIKQGVFQRRTDRSMQTASHPVRLLEEDLKAQLQRAFEALHRSQDDASSLIQSMTQQQGERMAMADKLAAVQDNERVLLEQLNLSQSRERDLNDQLNSAHARESALREQNAYEHTAQAALQKELTAIGALMAQAQTERARAADELSRLYRSKSWRITHPLRVLMTGVAAAGRTARRARNALRYVARGDLAGLRNRLQARRADLALESVAVAGPPQRWGVMATAHTLFIGHLIASRLRAHGWEADVMTSEPAGFPHDMYVVICPQMFKKLPPGEKRIAYQMEQSVSSRWFTADYLHMLENSLAVLEYALVNIEFMAGKGIAYPHVHYLPVGADASYMQHLPAPEKLYDVLFYGDPNSSPRRRAMLDTLRQHFDVRVCSEVFGLEMIEEIRRARVVINLHYYENALLEMPRIQECLSLGVPVVSESSQDQAEYPDLAGAVAFFEEGDEAGMVDTVRAALKQGFAPAAVSQAALLGATRFTFMFDRFLTAMNFLSPSKIAGDGLPLPADAARIALSMPETIARRRIFEANRPDGCVVFDGVRLRPSWVGCGLSYANLARHALKSDIERLTVLEDDALLPPDFEDKMRTVHAYLDAKGDQWDVFAGVIASLHPDVRVLNVETFQGMRFVTIDRMISMVCNVYSRKALGVLAAWNPEHRDDQTNTIDKYLERQASLRVVVALPFLVGHREEVFSTLWGIQNTQYSDMIAASEAGLVGLAASSMAPHGL
ncbi:methyltransferase domain-containing protein [Pseudoduganella sp. S-14]|jgi:SAM-dependent methyltransferase|uniref:methyltransferase domain-containing protein n=1 Tax=Pseudoduganella sp. S-14 TaxID=3404065 RepID=UPI003CFA957E